MKKLLLFSALLTIAFVIGCDVSETATKSSSEKSTPTPPPVATQESGPTIGEEAPEIVGKDLDGVEFKLSDYRGKVVMLDFYGDW